MTSPPGLPPRLAQWASEIATAAAEYQLDPMLVAAVMDRESYGGLYLTPKGPGGTGDYGHGRGLMQIDDRTWAEWLGKSDWQNPLVNIRKGCEILREYISILGAEDAGVCAYNAGPGRARKALRSLSPNATPEQRIKALDAMTARPSRNYVSDVLERRLRFRRLTKGEQP